jgi:hypothetical protein
MAFKPRITYPSASAYVRAAQAGAIQPGQWVEFEGIRARFARADATGLVTFYHSTSMEWPGLFSKACKGDQQPCT